MAIGSEEHLQQKLPVRVQLQFYKNTSLHPCIIFTIFMSNYTHIVRIMCYSRDHLL